MKKVLLVVCLSMLVGCASMRNTVNRLQGDIEYFENRLGTFTVLLKGKHSERLDKVLFDAKILLDRAERASRTGDKIKEKKYTSALVDLMDILEVSVD